MSDPPEQTTSDRPAFLSRNWISAVLPVLCVIVVLAVVIPVTHQAWMHAQRIHSMNTLRQIGIADAYPKLRTLIFPGKPGDSAVEHLSKPKNLEVQQADDVLFTAKARNPLAATVPTLVIFLPNGQRYGVRETPGLRFNSTATKNTCSPQTTHTSVSLDALI